MRNIHLTDIYPHRQFPSFIDPLPMYLSTVLPYFRHGPESAGLFSILFNNGQSTLRGSFILGNNTNIRNQKSVGLWCIPRSLFIKYTWDCLVQCAYHMYICTSVPIGALKCNSLPLKKNMTDRPMDQY